MMTQDEIQTAISDGVITKEQGDALLARTRKAGAPLPQAAAPDEEHFRFLGGFNDIFVTLGLFLLIGALYGFTDVYGSAQGFALLSAAIALGLSEIFARRLRLALPSIILALMFSGSVAFGVLMSLNLNWDLLSLNTQGRSGLIIALGSAAAAGFHLWRYRVPINGVLIAGALFSAFITLIIMAIGYQAFGEIYLAAIFIGGFVIFITALALDMSDTLRITRRADIAFWLHLLAAPLLIHPVASLAVGDSWNLSGVNAIIILAGFAMLSVLALIIDRRALLVSALSYAGAALAYVIDQATNIGSTTPVTLLALAFIVLFLSIGWHSLRRAVVTRLPMGRLRMRVPPVS